LRRQVVILAILITANLVAQGTSPSQAPVAEPGAAPGAAPAAEPADPAEPADATAANIKKPSQSDMLVGTRVPRSLDWSPPSSHERWRVWRLGIAASPGSYIRAAVSSGRNHLSNNPRDYGQGWGAFGQRYGNSFLTFSLQDTASQGLAAAAGYEMRYIQCKCTRVLSRIGHAMLFNFVTYNHEGKKVFNWPSIAGGYAMGMLSTTYTPNQKWSAQGLQSGNSAIYFGFASSLLQEFAPSKLFSRRKNNKSLTAPPVTAPPVTAPRVTAPTAPAPPEPAKIR